jgi:hypothetical protein
MYPVRQLSIQPTTNGSQAITRIAQEIIEDLFRDVDEVDCYIDDVGCFNNSWEEHLESLSKVLTLISLSILSNANGGCKKPVGLVIG